MRILIVDDSPEARFCLREQVEVMGHSVVGEAEDLKGTLALYEKAQPQIVLLDMTLEREDGIMVLRALRERDPAARVVILSANEMDVIKREALDAGASDYLVKPVDVERLQSLLDR